MVTGDNLLTAIRTARDCHMVDANTDIIIARASETSKVTYELTHADTHAENITDVQVGYFIKVTFSVCYMTFLNFSY